MAEALFYLNAAVLQASAPISTIRSRNRCESISAISYHIFTLNAVYQFIGLGDVVCLTPSERESQWIAPERQHSHALSC